MGVNHAQIISRAKHKTPLPASSHCPTSLPPPLLLLARTLTPSSQEPTSGAAQRLSPMVRVRLPKRPATPSESDDETEESESGTESEGEAEESEWELMLPVGAEAEVRSDDPGFVGSFYEVTVTGHLASRGGGRYTVAYSTLVAEDGGPLEETAAAGDVRPRPPREGRREFAVHEAVEAFHNEGWWAGVVSAVPPPVAGAPRVYQVAFPTSRETMEFEVAALRPHRVFQAGRWVPAAEVKDGSPLFREGTQVEVSQPAKRFGESWSPASVHKVIGATNFLVQYANIREDQVATEIIDSQYIRPAPSDTRMDSKYRASLSCHVEVIYEGSWWPGVIQEVLAVSGIDNKYVVKLKSCETDMEDVEFLDVLIVGITQLRPHFDWDGKKWVRRLTEEFLNGTNLTSRKRPSSSAMSLHKEVGESSDKHCSYREKRSRCSPEETMKQRNAVVALGSQLAPPSLPSMAETAHLSDSSLPQSSHPEQTSSQKIITPSPPVHQSPQLQASLLRSSGQPRPHPQGSLFGVPSHNPQIPKKRTAAKSIEESRNTVPISENLANLKNGAYDAELGSTVTAGHGMVSEINTGICVDPTMPLKDAGGSQHVVQQQGGGSAMDDWLPESLAIEHVPTVKTSQPCAQMDEIEIVSKAPQRPHLNQPQQHCPELREGMAFGLMLSFPNLQESINMLDIHQDDNEELFEEKMQGLSLLEAYGFDVGALRSRVEALLCRKNSHGAELCDDDAMKMLREKIACKESDDKELGGQMRALAMAIHSIGLYACLVRDMLRSAVTRKMNNATEISRLRAEANLLEQLYASTAVSR
ncbi:hypothetical protein ACQ4PT_021274 [Festuca glaucescens]